MSYDKNSNPQRINGMQFKTQLCGSDISTLMLVYAKEADGFNPDLNKDQFMLDTLRNLMRHGLVKIDIHEFGHGIFTSFSVTQAGKDICVKIMGLTT